MKKLAFDIAEISLKRILRVKARWSEVTTLLEGSGRDDDYEYAVEYSGSPFYLLELLLGVRPKGKLCWEAR